MTTKKIAGYITATDRQITGAGMTQAGPSDLKLKPLETHAGRWDGILSSRWFVKKKKKIPHSICK